MNIFILDTILIKVKYRASSLFAAQTLFSIIIFFLYTYILNAQQNFDYNPIFTVI